MSLLAELEELQRCLEGTADSDSEEADNPAIPTEESKLSEKEAEPSLTKKNGGEPTSLVQNSASKYLSFAESSCKKLNVEEESAYTDAENVITEEFSVDLGQSAAISDKSESSSQVSKSHTSSWGSVEDKGLSSEGCGQEQKTTSTHMITAKSISSGSRMPLANSSKDSADVKVSRAEILVVSSSEKHSPSRNVKILTFKQNKVEVPSSKPEEVKMLTCKVPNISVVNKDLLNAVSLSTNVSKMGRGSPASESKDLSVPSLALVNEKGLIVKKVKLEDKKNDNSSPLGIVEETPLELQTDANKCPKAAVMLTSVVTDKSKMQEVKLLGSRVKTHTSKSGFVASNKTKSESTDMRQPSSTIKVFKPCMNSSQGRKSDSEHRSGVGTTGQVQPTYDSPVFSVDSKMSRLEEVKISNGRPVIRVVEVSSDSNKTENEIVGISARSSGSVFVVSKANVSREVGSMNSPPVVMKRKTSFETGPAVGHVLGEKRPLVSVDSSKHTKPEEPEANDAGSDIKKRKLSTETGPLSLNTSTTQLVSEEKCSFMSSEIQKMGLNTQTAPKTSEPKLLDDSVKERKVSVDSESLLLCSARLGRDSEGEHSQELCSKLELEEGVFLEASNSEAAKINFDTLLLKKRRVSSDPAESVEMNEKEGHPASGIKRQKLSVPEVIDLAGEETLNSESSVQNPGSVKVARSPTTKTVPIISTMEVTISPHGVEQNVQTIPVSKSEEHRVNGDDVTVEKEDPRKKLMDARVVLKKLNIPIPEHLLPLPAQDEQIANAKQSLHKTLEKVSAVLQATLTESSAVNKRKFGKPKKLQDHLVEPVKEQKVMRRPALQQKIIAKPAKQKIMGKQAQHKIIGKVSQQKTVKKSSQQKIMVKSSQHKFVEKSKHHNVMGKSSQQKLVGKPKQQKNIRKPVQQQDSVSKSKTIRKTSPTNLPSIAVRIGAKKKKKKKIMPKKVVSSKNKTKSQKVGPSIIAKKTIKQISFGNLKYKQSMKSTVNRRPEDKKKIVGMQDKNVALNRSKQNNFDRKEKMIVPKMNTKVTSMAREKEMVALDMKVKQSAMRAAKKFQQKNPVAMKKQLEPKKVDTDDKRTKKSQQIPIEPSRLDGGESAADDEWIVEVLLDDSELDMMAVTSQVELGQDTNIGKVSSSDDRPKDLHVSSSDLDATRLLECDSSTDTNRSWKPALGGGKQVRRTISASKSEAGGTLFNTNMKRRTTLPSVKQVTSSLNTDKRTGISAEQKMAEMRKAIGDLERIADRSMLRLKAEERQVMYLTNRLHQYENDKHHIMLRKILKDGAPGPKQNPDAMFILDLLLSYSPEDGTSVSS
jgi:hypothetical protein